MVNIGYGLDVVSDEYLEGVVMEECEVEGEIVVL